MSSTGKPDGVGLIEKACDVLDAVSAASGGIGQAELAAQLGLPRTTLYRILAALVDRGLLRQDATRRVYAIGFRLLEMAQGAWSAPDLPAAAAPELRALRDLTGETAYIAVLEGREVMALGKFEGAHEVRSAARLGQRKPLHCTSQGKAILAFLPVAEREAILRRLHLNPLTARTITDRKRLQAALDVARARGFAVDDEEILEGVRCVGAPVLDAVGSVVGALSIAGPAWRMTLERVELLGAEVAAAGKRIGAQLRPQIATAAGVATLEGPACFYGLGPRWSDAGDHLWLADALAPELRRVEMDGTVQAAIRWETPIRAFTLCKDGGPLVVDTAGIASRLGPDGSVRFTRTGSALARLTALAAHPDGTAWASVPDERGTGVGPLAEDGSLQVRWRVPGRVSVLAWSRGGETLFAAAPESGAIHRLQVDRPAPLLLARLPAGSGRPAALATDAGGAVWVALRDGWSVARLAEGGEIERLLALPVPRPTGLCFGGPDLATLFVATARDGVGLDILNSAPLSGRLLALRPGVVGAPEPTLAIGFPGA